MADDQHELVTLRWNTQPSVSDENRHQDGIYSAYVHPRGSLRQKKVFCESIISLLLGIAYLIVAGCSFISFYLLLRAEKDISNDAEYVMGSYVTNLVVYILDLSVVLVGILLIVITLIKAGCGAWYSRYTLLLDFLLLGLCVIVSAVVCIMMTVAGIVNSNHKSCLTQEGSGACPDAENLFGYSLIISWGTLASSAVTLTIEAFIAMMLRIFRRRKDYQRL